LEGFGSNPSVTDPLYARMVLEAGAGCLILALFAVRRLAGVTDSELIPSNHAGSRYRA